MKKLFIAIIILMICVSAIVLGTTRAFGVIDTEGYAIPADAGIVRALAGEGSAPIPLAQLHRDDEIYKAATGCYVGADRKKLTLPTRFTPTAGQGSGFSGRITGCLPQMLTSSKATTVFMSATAFPTMPT